MWTAVIADDEQIIVHGLQKLIDWSQFGIRFIGTANDGETALSLILDQKPDIAILDVSMPGRTGLQILESIHAASLSTKVIFISGFRQFDYAIGAIRLGAVNYLLKPVNRDDLIASIRQALPIDTVMEKNDNIPAAEEELPETVTAASLDKYIPVIACLIDGYKMRSPEHRLRQMAAINEMNQWSQRTGKKVIARSNDPYILLLFANQSRDEVYQDINEIYSMVKEKTKNPAEFLIGNEILDITFADKAVAQMAKKFGRFYFYGWLNTDITYVEDDDIMRAEYKAIDSNQCFSELIDSALEMDVESAYKIYQKYCQAITVSCGFVPVTAETSLMTMYNAVIQRFDALGDQFENTAGIQELVKEASDCLSYNELTELIWQNLKNLIETIHHQMLHSDKKEALRAVRYIDEHYMEDLTLETMASYAHMNPSYFSSYFKKQTNTNFKKYLDSVRLRHALYLLISTDKKTYEIADETGFNDVKSLTELFRKHYGKTPLAYRKELNKDIS
jgi:two-component system response regulator YesN